MTASFEARKQFTNNYDQIFQRCQEAVHHCHFRLRRADPSSGRIEAKVGMGLRSWGENIIIEVDREGGVLARSECSVPTQSIAWGKNEHNVNHFFDRLSVLLNQPATPPVSTSPEPAPAFKILEESDVREHTEIVGTEELPLDNRRGSDVLTVEHEFSKTVTNEISVEIERQGQVGIKLDLLGLLKVEVAALLSRQLGYKNGESTTRRHTSRFTVSPGDSVIYEIVWKRKTRTGKYEILAGNQRVTVPFNARFGLQYEVKAK